MLALSITVITILTRAPVTLRRETLSKFEPVSIPSEKRRLAKVMRPSPLLTTPSNALSPRLLMFSKVLQYTERGRDPTTQYEEVIFHGGWDFS